MDSTRFQDREVPPGVACPVRRAGEVLYCHYYLKHTCSLAFLEKQKSSVKLINTPR